MRQSSIIIHKGRNEEKYEIYIEDYVMSFLKEETGTLELSEFYFYGFRENENKRYIIYGVGRDKKLSVFDKYSLLDEVGCRLTQAGPIFFIKEGSGIYEIKGYEVFYQDNEEMQSYLIERKKDSVDRAQSVAADETCRTTYAYKTDTRKISQNKTPYSAISIQLSIILVALVAIVINSTNSYDKMRQLNQSASEVFFAIENQEADNPAVVDGEQNEIVVERSGVQGDTPQGDVPPDEPDSSVAVSDAGLEEDVLKLVTLENEEQAEAQEGDETSDSEENIQPAAETAADESEVNEGEQQEETRTEESDGQEGVEALSRNVARYYEVEKGDTLYTISKKIYGDTTHVQRICELNQITNPDNIRYGQKIILP